MVRRFLLLIAVAAVVAAAVRAILGRRTGGVSETNGGRERTEELRREIEAARARLRERIRTQEG
jgi:Tfp pilus assembly protein PilN